MSSCSYQGKWLLSGQSLRSCEEIPKAHGPDRDIEIIAGRLPSSISTIRMKTLSTKAKLRWFVVRTFSTSASYDFGDTSYGLPSSNIFTPSQLWMLSGRSRLSLTFPEKRAVEKGTPLQLL
jgi:hypothetical protein